MCEALPSCPLYVITAWCLGTGANNTNHLNLPKSNLIQNTCKNVCMGAERDEHMKQGVTKTNVGKYKKYFFVPMFVPPYSETPEN